MQLIWIHSDLYSSKASNYIQLNNLLNGYLNKLHNRYLNTLNNVTNISIIKYLNEVIHLSNNSVINE